MEKEGDYQDFVLNEYSFGENQITLSPFFQILRKLAGWVHKGLKSKYIGVIQRGKRAPVAKGLPHLHATRSKKPKGLDRYEKSRGHKTP